MKRPEVKIPENIAIAEPVKEKMGSVALYSIPIECDVVRVCFVFHAGTALQPMPFCASATANLLSEGTRGHTALEIANRLDFYGSYFDVSVDRDYAVVSFCSLSKFAVQTLEVAEQIIAFPSFERQEVDTYRRKQKQALAVERSKIGTKAREALATALFGAGHPYGRISSEKEYDNLSGSAIRSFYNEFYTAANCFIVASGDVNGEVKASIRRIADALSGRPAPSLPDFPAARPAMYTFVEYSGAVQSAIRCGLPLFPRPHPDFVPMQVVSTILGGYFGSRLIKNLREERGYTYGVISAMVNLDRAGYLAIATDVAREATDDALEQIFYEVERLRNEAIPEEELELAKSIMLGEVMRILDGPFGIADIAIESIQTGSEEHILKDFLKRVRGITPSELLDTARKYLNRDDFVTVIAGCRDR